METTTRRIYVAYSPVRPEFLLADKVERDVVLSKACIAMAPHGADLARLDRSYKADKARFNEVFLKLVADNLLADYFAYRADCKKIVSA